MKFRLTLCGLALGLLIAGAASVPATLEAQGSDGRWFLQPRTGVERVVAPFLEGWYENEDGTYSFSFGYLNLNDEVIEIPVGEGNNITPAQFDGMQPTTFQPGKHRGVFAVTVPASMRDQDVWWTITNPNGKVTKVPGRTLWNAYQLDWNPRPHGTVPPAMSFDDGSDDVGRGPPGVTSQRTVSARVGSRVELSVDAEDISVRDPADPRFREPTSVRVLWSQYQGPAGGEVEFARHESTPEPEPREGRGGGGGDGGFGGGAAGPESIMLTGGGTARVYATFSVPGEYVLRAQADNWRSPDSSSGDQCCWTNAYVRVNVTQ